MTKSVCVIVQATLHLCGVPRCLVKFVRFQMYTNSQLQKRNNILNYFSNMRQFILIYLFKYLMMVFVKFISKFILFVLYRGRKIYEPPRFMTASQAAEQIVEVVEKKREECGNCGLYYTSTNYEGTNSVPS